MKPVEARADSGAAAPALLVTPDDAHNRRRLRAGISHNDSAQRLSKLGVDVDFGDARFVAADAVEAGGATLRFARAVIATGGRAATPGEGSRRSR